MDTARRRQYKLKLDRTYKLLEDMSKDCELADEGLDYDGVPSIPEWYSGRTVLVTGGTGFMGKVLVEKLLRSCPELRTIYMLMRARKGRDASTRIDDITKQPLFDRLRNEQPTALQKLVPINGDIMEVGLGLSPEDRQLLEREVTVVFHSAASVRFDDTLRAAILMNVRGTREVLHLATGFHDLQAFVHFSTTFSNCDRIDVGEHLYPPPGGFDWKLAIRMAENTALDPALLYLTPKILGMKVNTYLFAKALGEHAVNDYRHQLPVVIVRPSIVMSTYEEPIPGWVDNLNGPIAMWLGAYTGVLRIAYVNGDDWMDFVPVDSAVKSIIYIGYHRALAKQSADHMEVFNCSSLLKPCIFTRQRDLGMQICAETPTTQMLWCPSQVVTNTWWFFYLNFMLLHVVPAFLMDAILKYRNQQPRLMRMYRRMYTAIRNAHALAQIFKFRNENFLAIEKQMLPRDRKNFGYTPPKEVNFETVRMMTLGARQYLLKDPLETIPKARLLYRRFYWLDWAVKVSLLLGVGYLLATSTTLMTTLSAISFH